MAENDSTHELIGQRLGRMNRMEQSLLRGERGLVQAAVGRMQEEAPAAPAPASHRGVGAVLQQPPPPGAGVGPGLTPPYSPESLQTIASEDERQHEHDLLARGAQDTSTESHNQHFDYDHLEGSLMLAEQAHADRQFQTMQVVSTS